MTFLKSPTWAELGCELTFPGVQAPCATKSITLRPTQHHVTLRQELPGCPGDKGCLVSRVPPTYEAPAIPSLDYISLAKAWPRPAVMQVQSGGESHKDPAAFVCVISQGRHSDPLGDGETEAQNREGTCVGHRTGDSVSLDVSLMPKHCTWHVT